MVLFSIGLPSRFADWCDALIARLLEHRSGSAQAIALNSLEELATAVIKERATNLVVCSRWPLPRLQSEILLAEIPILVALGDPRAALRHLVEWAGYPLADATRAIASSCAAMLTMTTAKGALVLGGDQAHDRLAIAASIVRHFEIPIGGGELTSLVASLPDSGLETEQADGRVWLSQRSEREQAIINGATQPYIAYFAGDGLERLVWEPELFYVTDDPPAPTPMPVAGPIEITGRVRFLAFGPFINLPPGSWSADVVIGFSAEVAGMSFVVEVFAGSQLAQTRINAAGEEVVETRLYFTIGNTVDQPVQIRIMNERAAFDGRLALGYVAVTPQSAVSEETRQRLTHALRQ